ncbi:MAG TPA: hypothetical protein VIS10_10135 [Anaerolineales bacterium]
MKSKYLLMGVALLALAMVIAACAQAPAPVETTPCPEAPPCPDCPAPPEPPSCPEAVVKDVPFEAEWVGSPHNDTEAEAFNHWNEDDPQEVPTSCARCHSTPGYQDYLGADGSAVGEVDQAAPIGTTIQCVACHNAATATLSSVTFPSGVEVTGLGREARCMVCHQGRASKVQVDSSLEQAGLLEDLDTVNAELGFINIHYYAAGATLYGGVTMGGYQYEGKMYDAKFRHVEGIDTCVGCHNPHTTELKLDVCAGCHEGVAAKEDLKKVRMNGSLADYDGDGDTSEGVAEEMDGLRAMLLTAIQAYASEVAGAPIGYNSAAYPYFFIDTNADGEISDDEAVSDNRYVSWTGRLLRAGYNYQVSVKDPGAHAHGGKYIIQLLYDSIEDLNTALSSPVDLSTAHREDPGHFAGDTEPFRHWDEEGEVPGSCARCHSATGLRTYIQEGVNVAAEIANGFMCVTCHNEEEWPARYAVNEVTFPSGATLTFGEGKESNLCIVCHQGRSSTPTVNRALGDKPADTVDDTIRFSNIHYFAAGATIFGNDAQGAYVFDGKEYVGPHPHVAQAGFECKSCHDVHALNVKVETCAGCHGGSSDPTDPDTYRIDATDWDGDGDTTEGVKSEIASFGERLYAGLQAYAKDKGTPLVYDSHSYPYFFVDADENGEPDANAEGGLVGYNAWTPNLLKSAYNYQYWQKDPGNFAHNAKFMLQILYDSIENVGGDVAGLTRP